MKFVSVMINNQRFFIGKRGVLSAAHPLKIKGAVRLIDAVP